MTPFDPVENTRAGGRRLPRQRRGTTPQLVGRFPDYDVLAEERHWDEATRRVVRERVENVPPYRFFDEGERAVLEAFCDVVTAQDAEPRIPVLAYVDDKLASGRRDGYRYFDLPDDPELWRLVAQGLDEAARERGADGFARAPVETRAEIAHRFARAELHGGVWNRFNVGRAWSIVMRDVSQAFYAHPWAWNEIGFGGPAYPRGYAAFGTPHLGEREHWEGFDHVDVDPVPDTARRGIE